MTEITLEPAVAAVVDASRQMTDIDLDSLPLEEAMRIARPDFPSLPPPGGSEDRHIQGPDGTALRVRLYYPPERKPDSPLVLYLHGGGFVAGAIEMDDVRCARLAAQAACIVASLGYRLAPEHPFPAAIEDAHAAWQWLTASAADIGGDSRRSAIYGSSAGGHIAVGATLLARQRGTAMPALQLLVNPALDPSMASQSYVEFRDGPFMQRARMAWYWKQYAGAPGYKENPLWAPLAADLSGLPEAYVITAEYDVLRDEGEAYAERLRAAGVDAGAKRYGGMIHGFMTVLPDHETSLKAAQDSASTLLRVFRSV